jgi:RNA polymerase sigma-70 factor (ECF subfamily)
MTDERTFEEVMARLRAGDEAAATELFQRFAHRLMALARRRLDPLVRRKADPEDVLQSVFRSFFLRHAQGKWDLGGWDGLWGLLTVLTVRKCGRRVGFYRAARRDIRREVSGGSPEDESGESWEALAREPTPAEAAELAETVEQLLRGLDDRQQQMLVLSLQGYATAEVGAQVGCTERTVERLLERTRKRLQRLQAEAAAEP